MTIEIRRIEPEQHVEFAVPLVTAFGSRVDLERLARTRRLPELIHRNSAFDGDAVVGSAGGYRLTMTTPGGSVATAGLTMVGVLPTHRRRGVLTRLVRRHFEDARAECLAACVLWASESSIYGRFGYGFASLCGAMSLEHDRSTFRKPVPPGASFHLLDETAALARFPGIWERVRAVTPGMMSRSDVWWEIRRLGDYDKGAPPLQRVLVEIDGRPEGYALYRFAEKIGMDALLDAPLCVVEAVAASPHATAALWRYLCDIDLVGRIEWPLMPLSHPLFHLVREPRRLRMVLSDALWLRLLDAEVALQARTWSSRETLVFELSDAFCPWNDGVYAIDGAAGRAQRSTAAPELRLDASALGSLYLGGITARQLAGAGDVVELAEGAIERADGLFRSAHAPWCPDIF
jgi:predicted acetyltransferase